MLEEINTINFEDKTSNSLCLVDFWAEWCETCKQQHQYLVQIANDFSDKIKVFSINAGENRFISETLGVRNIPDLLLINRGEIIDRLDGPQNFESIKIFINKHINK